MDGAFFDDLLRSLPWITKYPRVAAWLGAIALLWVLAILASYYTIGLGRDDIYVTQQISGTQLFITAPQTTHAEKKEYQFFIHTGRGADITLIPTALTTPTTPTLTVTPTATSFTNGLTATTNLTVTAVSGILLLPDQVFTRTLRSQLYQSVAISYTNDSQNNTFFGHATATITIVVNPGTLGSFALEKEAGWQTWLRRGLIQSLSGILLTTIFPALLFILARLSTIRKADLAEALAQLQRRFEQGVALFDQKSLDEIEKELNGLVKNQQFRPEQLQLRRRIQDNIDFQRLLLLLRLGQWQEIDTLTQKLVGSDQFTNDESKKKLLQFLLIKEGGELTINPKDYFLNDQLRWLKYTQRIDKLSIDEIRKLVDAHEVEETRLEENFLTDFKNRCRLSDELIPPKLQSKDTVYLHELNISIPYILDLKAYEELKVKEQILFITGSAHSGKTTTLHFLQNALRTKDVLYLPVTDASTLQEQTLSATTAMLLVRAILEVLTEAPYLWGYLSDETEEKASFLTKIEHYTGVDNLTLFTLGNLISKVGWKSVCLAIDNAPNDFDYMAVQRLLSIYLCKNVFIRVVLVDSNVYLVGSNTITLLWGHEEREKLFEAIVAEDKQWRPNFAEKTYDNFMSVVKLPGDIITWLVAIRDFTHNNHYDIGDSQWQMLLDAMEQARTSNRLDATDWVLDDWYEAKRLLTSL